MTKTSPPTLLQYDSALGLRSASPFCTKVEVLLVMTGHDYETETLDNPMKMPKKKLPALRHNGQLIADSEFIKRHLERAFNVDFDEGVAPEQRAIGTAYKKLCEEHLYWIIAYSRWVEPHNWPLLREAYFKTMPAMIRRPFAAMIKKDFMKSLWMQGLGRHSREELYALGAEDLASLASFLGDKPFFLGDTVSSADATVFTSLSSVLDCTLESPLKEEAQKHANLCDYTARMNTHFFGQAHAAAA